MSVAPRTNVTLGPLPNAPRPHLEAPLARRTAIVAFAFFLASALHLAARGIDLGEMHRAFPLYALGGFSVLIFGTSRLLVAGMMGRDVVGGARTSLATTALAAIGAAGVYATLHWAFALAWSAAALLQAGVLVLTMRRAPARPLVEDPTATPRTRAGIRALEWGALLYLLASALVVPLGYAGALPGPAMLHLVLVGFVITTIMAVASQILPRFTRVGASPAGMLLLSPLALAGPALMALGLGGVRALLPVGAAVEGAAFAVFAAVMLAMLARSHKMRPVHAAYAGAPLAIAVGGIVALEFAVHGAFASQLATHALLNVFGFVGLFVVAASTDLYGPALAPGAASAKRHVVVASGLTLVALALAAAGSWWRADTVARFGMLLYAVAIAWQLAGVVASHRRAERVVSRLR